MKAQIDKANAARAFKDRFSEHTANIVRIDEEGIAKRLKKKVEDHDEEDEIDDIDDFLAELDMNDPEFVKPSTSTTKASTSSKMGQDTRAELDSFVDSLI